MAEPQAPPRKFDPTFEGLTEKQALFLRFFLDADNPDTFMKAGACARAMGLQSSSGYQYKYALQGVVDAFLDDCGLSESQIKQKLVELMETHTDKVLTIKGQVEEWELPEGARVLAVSRDGENVSTIVSIRGRAPELQLRALDMALKVRGMYAAEKHEHTGKDGEAIELTVTERAARATAILNAARARRDGQAPDGGSA